MTTYHAGTEVAFTEEEHRYSGPPTVRVTNLEFLIRPRRGTDSLLNISLRVAVKCLHDIRAGAFQQLPWHIARKLLFYRNGNLANGTGLPFKLWALHVRDSKNRLEQPLVLDASLSWYNLAGVPKLLDTSLATSFLTVLDLSNKNGTFKDFLTIGKIRSLIALRLHDRGKGGVSIDDSLVREWARTAWEPDSTYLRSFRIACFRECSRLTTKTLEYLSALERLQVVCVIDQSHWRPLDTYAFGLWKPEESSLSFSPWSIRDNWRSRATTECIEIGQYMAPTDRTLFEELAQMTPILSIDLHRESWNGDAQVFTRTSSQAQAEAKEQSYKYTQDAATAAQSKVEVKRTIKRQKLEHNGLDQFLK